MAEEHDSWLEGIGVNVGGVLETAVQTVATVGASIPQSLGNAGSAVLAAVESAPSGFSQPNAASAGQSSIDSFSGAFSTAQNFVGDVITQAEQTVSAAREKVSDFVADVTRAVEQVVEGELPIVLNQSGVADAGILGDAGDAGAPEEPSFSHSESTNKILADSASEFVSKANQVMGGGAVGELQPDVNWSLETDDKGRVTKVNMVVKSKIVRPVWAGGRPIGNESEVIKKAQRLVQEHELRHRGILEDFSRRAVTAARGKSAAEAEKTLKKFMKDMDAAQDALDAKEGMLRIVSGDGKETDVILVPVTK